jgi:HK97 family phage major capsid protein
VINWTMPGNVAYLPVDENSAEWSTSGTAVETRTEGQAKTEKKPALAQPTISLTKYSSMIPMSDEFINDTIGDYLQYAIQRQLAKIRYAESTAIVTAITGSGALIAVNSYTTASIYWIDILNMYQRVAPQYRNPGLCWLVNTDGEAELLDMAFDPSATAGKGPLYLPGGFANGPASNKLLGWDVLVHPYIPRVGTDNAILIANLGEVIGFRKNGPRVGVSEHFAFDQDIQVLKLTDRFGAATWSATPLTDPKAGSATLSAFVGINY